MCGNDTFGVNVVGVLDPNRNPDDDTPATFKFLNIQGPGHHTFYGINCSKCGHTDLFHHLWVDEWLKKQP
jgi:hypothetical protein